MSKSKCVVATCNLIFLLFISTCLTNSTHSIQKQTTRQQTNNELPKNIIIPVNNQAQAQSQASFFASESGINSASSHGSGDEAMLDNRNSPTLMSHLRLKQYNRGLRDAFHEDYNFVVRVRVVYNQSSSLYCNGVIIDEQLVLTDVSCIKYHGMANIEAKYLRIMSGEFGNETTFDVEQVYVNKIDVTDPGTELALLKLSRSAFLNGACKQLSKPQRNFTIEVDAPVRIVGYTNVNHELKEVRTKVGKRERSSKYICLTPAELNETPGFHLLKGAAMLSPSGCNQVQLVGILTRIETFTESIGKQRQQDCFVVVSPQTLWIEKVRQLSTLTSKMDKRNQPSVIEVPMLDTY